MLAILILRSTVQELTYINCSSVVCGPFGTKRNHNTEPLWYNTVDIPFFGTHPGFLCVSIHNHETFIIDKSVFCTTFSVNTERRTEVMAGKRRKITRNSVKLKAVPSNNQLRTHVLQISVQRLFLISH
jgi:hypothetical protein